MNQPKYIVVDAAEVVFNNISKELCDKLSYDDIIEILETEFEYPQSVGFASEESSVVNIPIEVPAKLDEDAMAYFIINQCAKKGIYLNFDELQEILDAEILYLEQQGLIDEDVSQYLN